MSDGWGKIPDSYRVPNAVCTNCGKDMDSAAEVDESTPRSPQPGDWALCFYCRHLMVYGNDLRLRDLNDKEVIEAAGDPEILQAMKMFELADQQEGHDHAAQTPTDDRARSRADKRR